MKTISIDTFGLTATAAAVGALGAGVLLEEYRQYKDLKKRNMRYNTIRAVLVSDLVHNLKAIVRIFNDADKPYHFVEHSNNPDWFKGIPPHETAKVNGHRPHPIHLDGWELAKPFVASAAPDPREGTRFSQAFQAFYDCLPSAPERTPSVEARGLYHLGYAILQPTLLLRNGLQAWGMPHSVHDVFGLRGARDHIIELILDFGGPEDVKWAKSLRDEAWGPNSWEGVRSDVLMATVLHRMGAEDVTRDSLNGKSEERSSV